MNHNFVPKNIHCLNPNLICYEIKQTGIDETKVGILDLVFEKNGEEIYVDYIEIKDEYRGSGIGTEILNNLILFAKNFGSKRIYFIVDFQNEKAQKLYIKLGFKFTDKIIQEFNGICYEMEMKL